ncbi:MAG: serine protease [Verrucomicrobiota bacterium]
MADNTFLRIFRFGAALSGSILLAGCASHESGEQARTESFQPFEGIKVGSDSIRSYTIDRTAILIAGIEQATISPSTGENTSKVSYDGKPSGFGSAVAIDPRGYFLTAAHCIDGPHVTLLMMRDNGLESFSARVVYLGDPDSEVADIAILHIQQGLNDAFTWSASAQLNEPVISAGSWDRSSSNTDQESSVRIRMSLIGGHIVDLGDYSEGGINYRKIEHESPIIMGYSGGPLINTGGELLGINLAGTDFFIDPFNLVPEIAEASRPDLDWLTQTIDQDYRQLSNEQALNR